MIFTGRQTVTVVHRTYGPPDALGVPSQVETRTEVTGCSVQPLSTTEEQSNVDMVISRWKLFAPVDTALSATDAVIADSVLYEVDGDPQIWTSLSGRPYYLGCFLRKARG